jgi:hypothetical protein
MKFCYNVKKFVKLYKNKKLGKEIVVCFFKKVMLKRINIFRESFFRGGQLQYFVSYIYMYIYIYKQV